MYDELIKRLRNCAEGFKCRQCEYELVNGCRTKLNNEAADAIEELQQIADHYEETAKDYFKDVCYYLERVPKWIPVSERLPEPNAVDERGFAKAYLVKTDRHVMMHTARWDGMYWILWGKSTTLTDKVTHWMPLPTPPKGEHDVDTD